MMAEEAHIFSLAELADFAVPVLRRLARSSAAELAVHGFKPHERFDLNRLAWLLPEIVRMEATDLPLTNKPGQALLPSASDMDLLRRVSRILNPEG